MLSFTTNGLKAKKQSKQSSISTPPRHIIHISINNQTLLQNIYIYTILSWKIKPPPQNLISWNCTSTLESKDKAL